MDTACLSQQFKALSDPVRLRLLALLCDRESLCVCDLIEALQLPQSVVSRHLSYLRRHGLVSSERRGTWQYYRHCLGEHPVLSHALHALFSGAGDIQRDRRRLINHQACCE